MNMFSAPLLYWHNFESDDFLVVNKSGIIHTEDSSVVQMIFPRNTRFKGYGV
jgi:hypothetical protein